MVSILSWDCIKVFVQGYSHLEFWLGLEDPLPRLLNHMAVGRKLTGATWVSALGFLSGTWLSPSQWFKRKIKAEATASLIIQPWKWHLITLPCCPGHTDQSWYTVERIIQKHRYQEVGMIGVIVLGSYHMSSINLHQMKNKNHCIKYLSFCSLILQF